MPPWEVLTSGKVKIDIDPSMADREEVLLDSQETPSTKQLGQTPHPAAHSLNGNGREYGNAEL